MLYKRPVWKKNYQNLVKTTSFESRGIFEKGMLLFFGGEGQNFKLAGAKSL